MVGPRRKTLPRCATSGRVRGDLISPAQDEKQQWRPRVSPLLLSREPVAQVRRQEHRLVSVAAEEALGHGRIFFLQTDRKAKSRMALRKGGKGLQPTSMNPVSISQVALLGLTVTRTSTGRWSTTSKPSEHRTEGGSKVSQEAEGPQVRW